MDGGGPVDGVVGSIRDKTGHVGRRGREGEYDPTGTEEGGRVLFRACSSEEGFGVRGIEEVEVGVNEKKVVGGEGGNRLNEGECWRTSGRVREEGDGWAVGLERRSKALGREDENAMWGNGLTESRGNEGRQKGELRGGREVDQGGPFGGR
jgi:hypothetical protein